MDTVYVIVAAILFFISLFICWHFYTMPYHHLPNPISYNLPILGNVPFLSTRYSLIQEKARRYKEVGDTYYLSIFSTFIVITKNPAVVEAVLSSPTFISKAKGYWIFKEWLGEGLFLSAGKKWRDRRKLLTPCFHFGMLQDYLDIMEKNTQVLIKVFTENAEKGHAFNVLDITKLHALNVICETAMGVELKAFDCKSSPESIAYIRDIDCISNSLMYRRNKFWFWSSWIYKWSKTGQSYYAALDRVHNFIKRVIEERVKELSLDPTKKRRILLDSFLDLYERGEIDVEGILYEVSSFMFAGHDTVSTALGWCLYMLGRNKECQEKASKEAKHINSMNITFEDKLKQMKYIECVIKEALRIHPSGPFVGRTVDKALEVNGIFIPKNTNLIIDIHGLHRDEQLWSDPLSFKPERFDETLPLQQKYVYSYVPFSAGPRNCLGQRFAMMELKIALYHCLLYFEITATQEESELLQHLDIIHGCDNGLMIKLANL